jgi:hypothetical protein
MELATPAIKRGILRAFNSGTYRAEVSIAGSLSTTLTNVPVARNIAISAMVAGRQAAIIFFDVTDPTDAVLCSVWE